MKDKDNSAELSANDGFMPNIYIIRGLQVMMDYDLAAIYGYETRRFNEQIKNNIERFDEDFRFQLTELEFKNLMPKFSTSSWGGTRKLPYTYTEQGIYMLMTVLKGDLAVRQKTEESASVPSPGWRMWRFTSTLSGVCRTILCKLKMKR
jgi:hypothetical protein